MKVNFYYDRYDKTIKTAEQIETEFNELINEPDTDPYLLEISFNDWLDELIEWCDVIPVYRFQMDIIESGKPCLFLYSKYTQEFYFWMIKDIKEVIDSVGHFYHNQTYFYTADELINDKTNKCITFNCDK